MPCIKKRDEWKDGRTDEQTNGRTPQKQYAPPTSKLVGGGGHNKATKTNNMDKNHIFF